MRIRRNDLATPRDTHVALKCYNPTTATHAHARTMLHRVRTHPLLTSQEFSVTLSLIVKRTAPLYTLGVIPHQSRRCFVRQNLEKRPSPPLALCQCRQRQPYSSHQQNKDRSHHRPAVLIGHDPIPNARPEYSRQYEGEGSYYSHSYGPGHHHSSRLLRQPFRWAFWGPVMAACLFYWINLETVPVSGRRRFNCMNEWVVEKFGDVTFAVLMHELREEGVGFLPDWDPRCRMVTRVMNKLIPVSGMSLSSSPQKNWEIYVVDAPDVANAMVIPGGKVIVFSGLFNLLIGSRSNDSALAAVLGHEMAHNLARHEAERMSGNVGFNIFLVGSIFFLSWMVPIALFHFGKPVLKFVTGLPMSRAQEHEADYIGLMMMAEACYDPHEALGFWRRMDAYTMGEPPEIISTHPSHKTRMVKVEEWMPEAMEKRAQSNCAGTSYFADKLRRAFEQGYIIVTM